MPIDINMGLFLQSVRAAFDNQQYQHATFLIDYAIKFADYSLCPQSVFPMDVAIGLDRGHIRVENEDCILALQGIFPDTQEAFGLFIVADGMGGHADGQEAAHLAIQTILEYVFPFLVGGAPSNWESILAEGIHQANRLIHLRNLSMKPKLIEESRAFPRSKGSVGTSTISYMGTTVTSALLVGKTAYIANVGDSRTYLYTQGLSRVTKDHSLVAQLLADGILYDEEEIYFHHKRNQITRALGIGISVDVDTFVLPLQADAVLLLCSDGLWEMTRDREIEKILASPCTNASSMVNQLIHLANHGGGTDNISCIVFQLQRHADISSTETTIIDPIRALVRLVTPS